jgi:succinate dehydrogenase/fumarate reductase flavoprotein subunit
VTTHRAGDVDVLVIGCGPAGASAALAAHDAGARVLVAERRARGGGNATTSGGPRRDARSRVVRPDGTPVPGLYAAGGAGTVWGPFTHSGGGLTDALVFRRLAGQESAQS